MKNSIGETSLVIIVLITIALISGVTTIIVNDNLSIVKSIWNNIINSENVIVDKTKSNPQTTVISSKENISPYIRNEVVKLVKDNNIENDNFGISKNIQKKLKKETDKNIKKISKEKLECTNDCKNIEKAKEYNYYKINNSYVVEVKDEKNQKYTISYKTEKNLIGKDKYTYITSMNTTNNEKKDQLENKNLKTNEENKTFTTINNYNDSYISMASVNNITNTFKDNDTLAKEIYEENVQNIVKINTYNNDIIVNTQTGFFLMPGIIITSWEKLNKSLLEGNNITALTNEDKSYNITKIISINTKTDIVLLKLDEEIGANIKIGNITPGEEILLLGTFSGFGISGRIGVNLDNANYQTNSLYVEDENIGSPIFNKNKEIIGIISKTNPNKTLSNSISSNVFKKYIETYSSVNFNDIKSESIDKIKQNYYQYNLKEEKKSISIMDTIWNKYKTIGNIENNIPLEYTKLMSTDTGISIRYINDTNIDNDIIIKKYLDELKKEGYKEKINTNKKKQYKGKYNITIYYEFNYIIILMEDN